MNIRAVSVSLAAAAVSSTVVDTNYGFHGVQSSQPYNHFSLLKSLEAGFGLPCLNHACDQNVNVMSDLFSERGNDR